MACRLINRPVDGKQVTSKTWDALYEAFGTEQQADEAYAKLTSPEFIGWFGDWINSPKGRFVSKAVNEDGEPMVMFRGDYSDRTEFPETVQSIQDETVTRHGIYFTKRSSHAQKYANARNGLYTKPPGMVFPVFLNIRNPHERPNINQTQFISTEEARALKNKGYDSVRADNALTDKTGHDEYIIFEKSQVKSINNVGTFEKANPNIYFNKKGRVKGPTNDLITAQAVEYNTETETYDEIIMSPLRARQIVSDLHNTSNFNYKAELLTLDKAVVRVDNTAGQREVARVDTNKNEKLLEAVLKLMPAKFGIKYRIVSPEKAVEMLDKQGIKRTPSSVESAFYNGKEVILVEGRFSLEDAIHEYAHPFVDALREDNPDLFLKLFQQLIASPDGETLMQQVKDLGYPEDQLQREVMVRALTDRALFKIQSHKSKSIIDRIWRAIKSILRDVFGVNLGKLKLTTTLDEMTDLLLGDKKINVASIRGLEAEIQMNRRRKKEQDAEESNPILDEMVSGQKISGKKQKTTLEALASIRGRVTLSADGKTYEVIDIVTGEVVNVGRASQFIDEMDGPKGQKGYYKFDGDENDYEDNRQWGNQIDDILTGVLLGETLEEVKDRWKNGKIDRANTGSEADLVPRVVDQLYKEFLKLREEYPDSVIINQQPLFNLEKGVAGTADIMVIHRDGTVDVLDLKTSINPTDGQYKKTLDDGSTVFNSYTRRFPSNLNPQKASKADRHQAQLSVYTGMIQSQGIVTNDNAKTIHIHLRKVKGNTVGAIRRESDKLHGPMTSIVAEFNNDNSYEGEPVPDIETSTELGRLLDKIALLLDEKKRKFARQGNKNAVYALERIQNDIESVTSVSALNKMIIESFNTLQGTKGWSGWFKIIGETVKKSKKDQIPAKEALLKLEEGKEQLELYAPVIKDMKEFYEKFFYAERGESTPEVADPESNLGRMRILNDNIGTYLSMINDQMPAIQAEILYPHIRPALRSLKKESDAKKKALDEYKAATAKRGYKPGTRSATKREKVTEQLNREYREIYRRATLSKEGFAEMIREGNYNNITNWFDVNVNPAISSSNELVAAVALATKDVFDEARLDALDFQPQAIKAFEKYKKASGKKSDDVEAFNEGLYKTEQIFTGKWNEEGEPIYREEVHFVNEIDLSKFETARAQMLTSIQDKPSKMQSAIKRRWYNEHTVGKPLNDVVLNGVVVVKGINSIIADREKNMTKAAFKSWMKKAVKDTSAGKIYRDPILTMPNPDMYSNTESYEQLQKNKPLKEYYDFLVSSYFKSQDKLPDYSKPGFRLPSVVKSTIDRFNEKGGIGSVLAYEWDSFSNIKSEDIERYGDSDNTVPVIYAQRMESKDVSKDLISSILLFSAEANKYEARAKIAPVADSLLAQMELSDPIETDSSGEGIISSAAKRLGLEDSLVRWKKDKFGGNGAAKLLAGFIQMQIYGKYKKKEMWGKYDMGKIADNLIKVASVTQIGGDMILGAANWLNAGVMTSIEASAEQFYNKADWAKGMALYTSHAGDFLKDFTQPYDKSLIGQIVDLYDPVQGTSRDKFGRKVSRSTAKKLLDMDTYYFNMSMGEHSVQVASLLAMMQSNKAKDKSGNLIPLYEAYELDENGKIRLKEGMSIDHLGELTDNGLVPKQVRNTLHSVNKSLHGVYNSFDKPIIEQHAVGRLLLMYRKFLVPGFKRRFQTYSANYEAGVAREGYYRTFWKMLQRDITGSLKYFVPFANHAGEGLTPTEVANMRRATFEIASIVALIIMINLLGALRDSSDDEDEKWLLSYPLYLTMRLRSELQFYTNPRDLQRSFRSPTATYSILEKFLRFTSQFMDDAWNLELGRYERNAGIAKKGDSKLWIRLLKLFGVNGRTIDPQEAIKVLELQTD